MQFGTGFGSSIVNGLYGGGGSPGNVGGAGAPAATAGPTGAPALMAAAWGTGGGGSPAGPIAAMVGAAAWVALIGMWWVLPR